MNASRLCALVLSAAFLAGLAACKDSDTTTAPGAIASVSVDAPDSVRSGQSFTIDVRALNVGINNVHNGRVEVMLPAPLLVDALDASPGTTATFSNGSGATVSWNLNTLDSNSQSTLHIQATGTLPAGSAAQTLTLRAAMMADGIGAGDAVTQRSVQLTP